MGPDGERVTSLETGGDDSAVEFSPGDFLLYDGECIYCRMYVRKSRFRTPTGKRLRLMDGRKAPELVAGLRRDGCDLEDGMVLVLDGRRYQGADAMTVLGSMTTGTDWFNRLARWFGSSAGRVWFFYPWFRRLRQAGLRVTGKSGFRE